MRQQKSIHLLMDKLADLRDSGMSIEEVYNWVLENRLYLHAWFFSTDLTSFSVAGSIPAEGTTHMVFMEYPSIYLT